MKRVLKSLIIIGGAVLLPKLSFAQDVGPCLYSDPSEGPNTLNQGEMLNDGNGGILVMQRDGNLVIYEGGRARWASQTYRKGQPPYRLVMQHDGNLVIYDGKKVPIWASGTYDSRRIKRLADVIREKCDALDRFLLSEEDLNRSIGCYQARLDREHRLSICLGEGGSMLWDSKSGKT